jgi:hypothetical protein
MPILARAYAGAYAYPAPGQPPPPNLPELQQMFQQLSDVETADMLILPWLRLLGYGWLLVVMMGDNCRCGVSQATLLNCRCGVSQPM